MRHFRWTLTALLTWTACTQAATVQVTVTGRDGQPLPGAVVLIQPATGAAVRPPPPVQATIEQKKMQFVPMVSVLPLGSTVRFTNLDGWEHHVRGVPADLAALLSDQRSGFELRLGGHIEGQPPASAEVTLDRPGPLQLGCHIHGSMRGSIFVADTPWAVLTDEKGVATLADVPEGAARLRVWHPQQLVEGPPLNLTVTPLTALTVPTQVVPRRRRL